MGVEDENAAIVEEGESRGLANLPRRLGRYHVAKVRAGFMADYLRDRAHDVETDPSEVAELLQRAGLLGGCASYLHFRHYFTVDRVALHAASFCQVPKLCPMCAIRRAARMLRKLVERFMFTRRQFPELLPKLVTVTVKNGPHLVERFEHLRKSLKLLNNRGKHSRNGRNQSSVMSRVRGGYWSIEIKRGEGDRGGQWHPHMHAVWMCSGQISSDDLSQEWKEITGDSHVVDVRDFHFVRDRLEPTADNVGADFAEVTKYALKFSTMTPADCWHAFDSLRGKMFARPFGCFHGITEDPSGVDDFDPADLPFIDLIFNHSWLNGFQQLHA